MSEVIKCKKNTTDNKQRQVIDVRASYFLAFSNTLYYFCNTNKYK